MSVQHKHLHLKPIEEADYNLLFTLWSNPTLIQYTYHQYTETLEAARIRIQKVLTNYKTAATASGPFLVFDHSTFIGYCGIDKDKSDIKSFEIWYIIAADQNGKGYGSAVAQLLVKIAFEQLEANLVCADVALPNLRSIRILEKAGLTLQQTLPLMFDRNGIQADLLKYAISKEEWWSRN